jgi:hypothetical protein
VMIYPEHTTIRTQQRQAIRGRIERTVVRSAAQGMTSQHGGQKKKVRYPALGILPI